MSAVRIRPLDEVSAQEIDTRAMITADFPRSTHRAVVAVNAQQELVAQSLFSTKLDAQGVRYGHFYSRYVRPNHRRQGLRKEL